jgi:hypothetical protein
MSKRDAEAVEKRGRGRPRKDPAVLADQARATVMNFKGTAAEIAWLESLARLTMIPKTTLVRLALHKIGKDYGVGPYPGLEDKPR